MYAESLVDRSYLLSFDSLAYYVHEREKERERESYDMHGNYDTVSHRFILSLYALIFSFSFPQASPSRFLCFSMFHEMIGVSRVSRVRVFTVGTYGSYIFPLEYSRSGIPRYSRKILRKKTIAKQGYETIWKRGNGLRHFGRSVSISSPFYLFNSILIFHSIIFPFSYPTIGMLPFYHFIVLRIYHFTILSFYH